MVHMEDLTQGKESIEIFGPSSANTFKYVKTNVPGPGCDRNLFMEEFQGCICDKSCSEDSCACFNVFGPAYKDGLLLENAFSSEKPSRSIIECGQNCNCQTNACALRLVQKGIRAKLRVVRMEEKGYGLEAEDEIARLAFVCEYAGEVVDESEARKRLAECERLGKMNYLIAITECSSFSQSQIFVDPRLEGNIGRFINHSCDPNLIMIPVRVNHNVPRLALFARRNIFSGEELTFDYSGSTYLDKVSYKSYDKINQSIKSVPQISEISRQTTTLSPDRRFTNTENIKVNDSSYVVIRPSDCNAVEASEFPSSVKRRKINPCSDVQPPHDNFRFLSTNKSFDSSQPNDLSESNSLQLNSNETNTMPDGEMDRNVRQLNSNETNTMPDGEMDRNRRERDKTTMDTNEKWPVQSSNVNVSIKRKMCLCKSEICSGFLPYDSQLFK